MFTLLFLASAVILYCTCAYYNDHEEVYFKNLGRTDNEELNLNESFFPKLLNYRAGGEVVDEAEYPWIAKVIHSPTSPGPYICTAVCIDKNIFISAARCVYVLKVVFTSLMYQKNRIKVKALVLPSIMTKQQYDDIGFIITNIELDDDWETIKVYDQKRTDNAFKWFSALEFNGFEHKVIGYAYAKSLQNLPPWHQTLELVELDVAVGIGLCSKILSYNSLISGFPVPCYHSCTNAMYRDGNKTCNHYLGVEGAALVNKDSNQLFGIATWGASHKNCELPVGFSIPNSATFYEDLKCALKIRDNQEAVTDGFYQRLCDSKRRYYYFNVFFNLPDTLLIFSNLYRHKHILWIY